MYIGIRCDKAKGLINPYPKPLEKRVAGHLGSFPQDRCPVSWGPSASTLGIDGVCTYRGYRNRVSVGVHDQP